MIHHATRHHYHIIRLDELKRLYWAHTIRSLAANMSMIFVPIYFYRIGYSVTDIMSYFLYFSIFWGLTQYPALRITNKFGANKIMALGLLLEGVHILMLATVQNYGWPLWSIGFIAGLAVAFYWPGFRACFAQSLLHKRIGPAVGVAAALYLVAYGAAPAIGGAIASYFGIEILYGLAMLCFIAAALPLFNAPEIVKNTDIKLSSLNWRRIKRDLVANFGDNIDDSVLSNIWPLFIFLLVPTYIGVGILSSITIVASIIISLYVGRKIRKHSGFLSKGSWLVSLTNGGRLFTQSAGHIAGVNFFNGMGHALMLPSYDARYYKNAEQEPVLLYVFAMLMAGAIGCALLFGILLLLSLIAPIEIVLTIGLLLAIPAGYSIRLIRA